MSVPFSAADAAAWAGASLLCGDPETRFGGVSIDSRTTGAGQLFVAIVGPRHDAHDHLEEAVARGAQGVLIEAGRTPPETLPGSCVVLSAPDTTRALGELGSGHRALHRGPVVAITGSNGKTTTKEMCAAILSVGAPCLKTRGNLNNAYGLPLTLLEREQEHESLVVELGMNHRGEIARLVEIARPTVGVVTNVGTAHIEFLGSRQEIALEKGDLVAGLAPEGTAVLNADDALVMAQRGRVRARVVTFGRSASADVRAENVRREPGAYAFTLVADGERSALRVAGLGETTVANALAAAAAALAAGASREEVARGLLDYQTLGGRLQPLSLPDGTLVIDDTYNANPQSLEVALRVLAAQPAPPGGRHVAVLGDMGELGEQTEEAHRQAGALAASLGVELLFAVGRHAGRVAEGARAAGLSDGRVFANADWEPIAEALCKRVVAGDQILVKGSRAMRMERIVERLRSNGGGA